MKTKVQDSALKRVLGFAIMTIIIVVYNGGILVLKMEYKVGDCGI